MSQQQQKAATHSLRFENVCATCITCTAECTVVQKGTQVLMYMVQAQCVHRTTNVCMYSRVEQPLYLFVCEYCAACKCE